jgi:hypothetical protein
MLFLEADSGTIQLYRRIPEPDPVFRAVCAISLGAQDLHAYRSMRLNRRGLSGVMAMEEQPYTVHLEGYGPTQAECEQAIAKYLRVFTEASWRTRFSAPELIDDEWVAKGSRNAIEGWY